MKYDYTDAELIAAVEAACVQREADRYNSHRGWVALLNVAAQFDPHIHGRQATDLCTWLNRHLTRLANAGQLAKGTGRGMPDEKPAADGSTFRHTYGGEPVFTTPERLARHQAAVDLRVAAEEELEGQWRALVMRAAQLGVEPGRHQQLVTLTREEFADILDRLDRLEQFEG